MRLFLIPFFVFHCTSSFSQTELWASANSDWYYTYSNNQFINGYTMYAIDRDTVVLGESAQVYSFIREYVFSGLPVPQQYSFFDSTHLIISLQDSVLYNYVPSIQKFDTIIDFAAPVGSSWNLYDRGLDCGGSYENYYLAEVIDKGSTTINGRDLLYFNIEYSHTGQAQPIIDTFYQQIGPSFSFWSKVIEMCNQIDMATEIFRCYESDIGLPSEYEYSVVAFECDYFEQVGLNDGDLEMDLNLYPNPIIGNYLTIHSTSGMNDYQLQVFDLNGREIQNIIVEANSNGFIINVGSLQSGNYYLKISSTNDQFIYKKHLKFVKE